MKTEEIQELFELMDKLDIRYHISERRDQGYLEASDEDWGRLKELLDLAGIK